jgi:hypothetical protein
MPTCWFACDWISEPMSNVLEQGAAWLADQLKTHASTEVLYTRGADQVTVNATIGKTEFEVDDGSGLLQRVQSRDYLIQAADLQLGGSPTLPLAGDRIRETVGDKTYVYEVMAPGKEPCYRFSDPFRRLLRIHTKLVATES